MFVVANLLNGIAVVLGMLLTFYMWVVIARVVISWINADPYNPIVRTIIAMTEPVLYRIRRTLPVFGGGIDFSPLVVWAAILFLQTFLVRSLEDLALRMQ
jgi:YggT family protein